MRAGAIHAQSSRQPDGCHPPLHKEGSGRALSHAPLCKGGDKRGIVTRHKPHICPRGARYTFAAICLAARYAPSARKDTVGADRIRPPQQRTERNPSPRHSRMCRRATAKKSSRAGRRTDTVGADRIRPPYCRGGRPRPPAITLHERSLSPRHSRMCRRATAKNLPRGEDQTDQNCSRLIPISGSGLRSTAPGRIRITISQVAETTARFRCPPKTSHRAFPALMCRC